MTDSEEGLKGKFNSTRDEVLNDILSDGWGQESSGNVEAPTGWFGRVSITQAELESVAEAFDETINRAGLADTAQLVGHFLLREDTLGFVNVTEFDSEKAVTIVYLRLEREYGAWEGQDNG